MARRRLYCNSPNGPMAIIPQRNVMLEFCAVFVFLVAACSAVQHRLFHQLCIARLRGVHRGSSSAKAHVSDWALRMTDESGEKKTPSWIFSGSFAACRLGHPSQQRWVPHGGREGCAPAARCPSARMLRAAPTACTKYIRKHIFLQKRLRQGKTKCKDPRLVGT